jgi:cytochrome c oxidase subunit 2
MCCNFRYALAGTGLVAISATARASNALFTQAQATRITADVYGLHIFMLVSVLVVFCVVFAVMIGSVCSHRRATRHQAVHFHPKFWVEITWALVPLAIVLGAMWPAVTYLLRIGNTSNADITIKATGMQWKWGYSYLNGEGKGVVFFSNVVATPSPPLLRTSFKSDTYALDVDQPLVVPVNKKIRMVFSATDAIHSWHIPALGVKQDAIPGLARDSWFTAQKIGTYRGVCSLESCGPGRACLLIVVKVVSEDDYVSWFNHAIAIAIAAEK